MCDLSDQINAQHHTVASKVFLQKTNREIDRQFWHSTFENSAGCALLAYDGEQVLGFITMSWHENTTIPFLYRRRICRIGTMDGATNWAHEHDAVEIRLEVFGFNRNAMNFYAAQGYGVQSHIMSKSLD